MKNIKKVYRGLLIYLTCMFLISSCSKEDTTAPVIVLNGDSNVTLELQDDYIELDAVAEDDEDGTLSVEKSGMVDTDLVGTYVITYTATDAAGNIATEERVVNVINGKTNQPTSDAFKFQGSYDCVISNSTDTTTYPYTESLSLSTTSNNDNEWSKFGDYGNANSKLNISFGTNSQISIPLQTITCGSPAVARTFSGSGTRSGSGNAGSTIILNITETVNGQSASFVYTYTKN